MSVINTQVQQFHHKIELGTISVYDILFCHFVFIRHSILYLGIFMNFSVYFCALLFFVLMTKLQKEYCKALFVKKIFKEYGFYDKFYFKNETITVMIQML